MTHICVSKQSVIASDNGLAPTRRQAIIGTNAGILLIPTLGTNFSEILSEILTFSFKKMCLKVSSAKWRPFCLGLNVLRLWCQTGDKTSLCHNGLKSLCRLGTQAMRMSGICILKFLKMWEIITKICQWYQKISSACWFFIFVLHHWKCTQCGLVISYDVRDHGTVGLANGFARNKRCTSTWTNDD